MKSKLLVILSCLLFACSTNEEKQESNGYTRPKKVETTSELTCPQCGNRQSEIMPTEYCQLKYTCNGCKKEIFPKDGDCCVFCSYGNHKCPSKQ